MSTLATGAIGDGVRSQQEIGRAIGAAYGFSTAGVPITGSPAEVAARLAEFHQAGAHHLIMGFSDGDRRQQCDLLAASHALLTA